MRKKYNLIPKWKDCCTRDKKRESISDFIARAWNRV